jgi:hypothetical protein
MKGSLFIAVLALPLPVGAMKGPLFIAVLELLRECEYLLACGSLAVSLL